ncbi:MAG: AsmA family protein [Roseibium sp.]
MPRRQSLNSVYITLGIAVILVLITALVGPFFIDWTVYRSTFETYAGRVLGHRVTVLGEADLRLLPAPSIRFSDVRVGEAEDPLLVVSEFKMRVELPPLLKGEFRVIDMEMDRPHLVLSLDEDGRLDWLTAMKSEGTLAKLSPEDVALERLTIRNGALSIIDARSGETHRVDRGNLEVSARSLAGPFKAAGSLTLNDAPYSVSFATGKAQEQTGLRIKGEVTPANWPVNFSFDGMLGQSDAAPSFAGDFDIASVSIDEENQDIWSIDGQFAADIAEIKIPEFEFRYGPEDKRLSMSGNSDLIYAGEKRFVVRAKSKQVDLDRLFAGGPQEPADLDDAGDRLISVLKSVPLPSIDGVVSMDVPAVVVGGGIVQNVRLDLETMLGGWRVARLAGRLPGRTTITTQGDLGLEPEMTYRGAISVKSDQPGSFFSWWQQQDTGVTTIDPVALEGRLNLLPDGAALDNLRLTLSGADAHGGLAFRRPRSGNSEFSLSLDAEKLDLDQVERLAALVRVHNDNDPSSDNESGLDVSVRLQARKVTARGVEGEGLAFEAEYSNGGVRIDRLFAADLAGARFDVNGEIRDLFSAPQGAVSGILDARDLSGLVALTGGLFPGTQFASRLEQAAGALVPARFDAELKAAAHDNGTNLTLQLNGTAGGAKTSVNAGLTGRVDAWQEGDLDLAIAMQGPDGTKLLQQLGFDAIPVSTAGAGELSFGATGTPSKGLSIDMAAKIGPSKIETAGTLTLRKNEDPAFKVTVALETPDLAPLALMSGRILPVMGGSIPANIKFVLEGHSTEVSVTNMSGSLMGTTFDGKLEGDLSPAPGEQNRRFSGELQVSHLDLRGLTELILGPDQWFSEGDETSIWPVSFFGAPLLDGLDISLDLRADRLQIDQETVLKSSRTELRLTPVLLRLDGLNGTYAGGNLEGSLSLRRSEAEGAASGRFKLTDTDLRQLSWRRDGRAVASGTLDIYLEFEGAGRSISSIVAGLNGGGTFAVKDGEFRGINPQAFPLVIRAVDAGLDLRDEKIEEVFVSHMTAGSLPFKKVEGTLTLVGGRLSARNVVVDSEKAEVFGSASLDINTYDLDADFSMKVDPGENAVTGAEPQVGLLFQGDVEVPVRKIDIAPFTAYLTLRAFEQEVERVERLQAEILERDRLSRELKRQRQAKARRQRAAEEAAAQAAEEELRRLQDLQETEVAPPETEQGNLVLPETDPLPRQASETTNDAGGSLTDRVRAILDGSNSDLNLTGSVSRPDGKSKQPDQALPSLELPSLELPPLDGPITVEDLINGQFSVSPN